RIRSDLHRLMRALAGKRYDEAAAALRAPAPDDSTAGEPWTAARLEQEMSPYFAAHATLSVTPLARRPSNTLIQEMGTRRWRAKLRLLPHVGRTFRILWQTSPSLALAVAALTVASGVIPAGLAWVGKLIIDSVVVAARAGGLSGASRPLRLVALELGLMMVLT